MELSKRSHWTWRQFFICFGISMGMLAFAYPAAVIATTLGQPTFLVYMELLTADGALSSRGNSLIGGMSGVFQVSRVLLFLNDVLKPEPLPITGWRSDWHLDSGPCQRQIRTTSCNVDMRRARSSRCRLLDRCTERGNVHRFSLLCRCRSLEFPVHQ